MSKGKVTVISNHVPSVRSAVSYNLVEALTAGGMIILAHAKLNIQKTFSTKQTGNLAESIVVRPAGSNSTEAKVLVGPTKVYGRIQELGGIIRPISAQMLSWVGKGGKRVFAHEVHIPPRPYLRPAVDEHKREIDLAISYQIEAAIKRGLGGK